MLIKLYNIKLSLLAIGILFEKVILPKLGYSKLFLIF
jgi:hypothetical protein